MNPLLIFIYVAAGGILFLGFPYFITLALGSGSFGNNKGRELPGREYTLKGKRYKVSWETSPKLGTHKIVTEIK